MWLAQRGVVSLLPDEPGSAPYWFDVVRKRESDARDATLTVAGLRRALDVLVATNAVDPKDLGLVRHDFGAMYGALMLAFDRRPTGAVFMTPTPTFREWFDLDTKRPPPDAAAYERQLAAFDLPSYLAHTTLRADARAIFRARCICERREREGVCHGPLAARSNRPHVARCAPALRFTSGC